MKDAGATLNPSSLTDTNKIRADTLNKVPGSLNITDGINCSDCMNRGYVAVVGEDGNLFTRECLCMARRRNLNRVKKSGLSDLLQRYTLDTWTDRESWQKVLSDMVVGYAENPSGWFFMAGRPGTGKTHLCTALCGLLMEKGFDTRYVLWRDLSVKAKAVVNDESAYRALVEPLKKVKVLYVDDLFKTGKGQEPSTGDVNLAFEILNNRYNGEGIFTILSSEWSIERLLDIDEALGSRIYERSKERYADLSNRKNFRINT